MPRIDTNSLKNIVRRYSLVSLAITFFSLLITSTQVSAISPSFNIASLGQCGTGSNQFSVLLKQLPTSADVYLKLTSTGETSSSDMVYFQSFSGGQCHLIGATEPVYSSWSRVGDYNLNTSDGGSLVLVGSGLGAEPYQAVASVLLLSPPAVCTPTTSCQVNYAGYVASLTPQIITGATDQVAVYVANPLSGVGYSKVSYFDNSQFLYSSSKLKPVDRNYLAGGNQSVAIQIILDNGQILTINQQINMGSDFTGVQYIKSLIYRSHNKALVFTLLATVVLAIVLALWVIRLVYKHHHYIIEHGLKSVELPKTPEDEVRIEKEEIDKKIIVH